MRAKAPERLLAKSERGGRPAQTIREHTAEVMRAASALVEATGEAQLRALGLDPREWLDRFRRAVLVAALLHDLGKANDHFQEMVQGRYRTQWLRHEAVSFLITRLPEIREWIAPALEGTCPLDVVLWATAGHHRKFPESTPVSSDRMTVYLDHPDFRSALDLGRGGFGLDLGAPPQITSRLELGDSSVESGERDPLEEAEVEAKKQKRGMTEEDRRFLAAVKACLICADVAGSIGRRGEESMADWIPRAFARAPTAEQLRGIVEKRTNNKGLRDFQKEVERAGGDVALVLAGCGTGKTVAAYARAANRHPGRRVFFCSPTTGTATEGYRDYLADPSLAADLIHGRSEVDKALEALLSSDVPEDVEPSDVYDGDESDEDEQPGQVADQRGKDQAAEASAGAMEQWSTPLIGCTVDTVLGLVQNNRRGIYAWPSIAGSFCVFDEIHAYDERLFGALLRFLRDVPGVPCLLMTASLPDERLRRLQQILKDRGEPTEPIRGPKDLEEVKRYVRSPAATVADAWRMVEESRARNEKVLWVVNTVDAALALATEAERLGMDPLVYHSRFRYIDRVKRHRNVIDAFKPKKSGVFSLAITTQVAEMSLDLSADLLVTQLAPIPSLIQRLGRLNRRAVPGGSSGTRPFVVYEPETSAPYKDEDLEFAREWLVKLGGGPISQRDLVARWSKPEAGRVAETPPPPKDAHLWLDGCFETRPGQLRESSPGLDVILEYDADDVKSGRLRAEEVRVPMNQPRGKWGSEWRRWPVVGFCPVAPAEAVEYGPKYHAKRGVRWKN